MRYSTLPLLGLIGLVLGCGTATQPAAQAGASPEEQVKAAFVTLQQALKDQKTDDIWELLDKNTQADAGRAADAWKQKLAKADAEDVKKQMGIDAEELSKLTGKGFLKTKAFAEDEEINELTRAKDIDVKMDSKDRATVSYPDEKKKDEKDHVKFIKQDGKWKALLGMKQPL
jgi:hypothetical protein